MTGERCAGCDAALAEDQRFCVACGLRCAPDELRLAALPLLGAAPVAATAPPRPGLPWRPVLRPAAATAIVVLTMGIGIGAAMGPAAVGQPAAASSPLFVVSTPPLAPAPALVADPVVFDEEPEPVAPAEAPEPSADETDPPAEEEGDPPPAAEEPPEGSTALAGVVVASSDGRVVLAGRDGRLLAIHAAGCGLDVGDDVHLRASELDDGTWAADRLRRLPATVEEGRVAGIVTWVDPGGGRYALGARGATLLVTTVDPAASLPAVGDELRARVALGEAVGELRRRVVAPVDPAAPPELAIAGVVASVEGATLVLALDDADEPATVTLSLPAGLDTTVLAEGVAVAATATRTADGSYAATDVALAAPAEAECTVLARARGAIRAVVAVSP